MTKEERYEQFKEDMWEGGFELYDDGQDYYGRYGYVGPAVVVDRGQEQAVYRATGIHLRTDSLGLSLIMYPG